jgi:hypothetical protein
LADYLGERGSPLIDYTLVAELFETTDFHSFARNMIEGRYTEFTIGRSELELD